MGAIVRLTPPRRKRQAAVLAATFLVCLLLYSQLVRVAPITPIQAIVFLSPVVLCALIGAFYTRDGRHLTLTQLRLSPARRRRPAQRSSRRRSLGLRLGNRLMPHEPPLLAAILVLLAVLGLLVPAATSVAPTDAASASNSASSTTTPGAPTDDARRAAPDPQANANAPVSKDDPTRSRPCPASRAVAASKGAAVAVSADEAGRFRLYGAPDPQTGLSGRDSYDLIRGCAAAGTAIVRLNPVRVRPGGARASILGPDTVVRETREERSDTGSALSTAYRIPGGLSVAQELSVVRVEGRFATSETPDTLRATYRLENETRRRLSASLSAVLAPPRGPSTSEHSGVPYFANHPADGPGPVGAVPVTAAAVLAAEDGHMPKEVIVPRPGAAASGTSYWRPLYAEAASDRLVFGSAADLALGPALPVTAGEKLSDSSAFAALWEIEIPPGGSRTVSYEYGQTSGWPQP